MSSLSGSESLLQKIRGEFLGTPGLELTPWQFQRLWSLDAEEAQIVLQRLERGQFLQKTPDGAFVLRAR